MSASFVFSVSRTCRSMWTFLISPLATRSNLVRVRLPTGRRTHWCARIDQYHQPRISRTKEFVFSIHRGSVVGVSRKGFSFKCASSVTSWPPSNIVNDVVQRSLRVMVRYLCCIWRNVWGGKWIRKMWRTDISLSVTSRIIAPWSIRPALRKAVSAAWLRRLRWET